MWSSDKGRQFAIALLVLLGLSACRVEVGRPGGSTPIPTPTPTPTPIPLSLSSASDALGDASAAIGPTRVALASADYFADSTAAAVEKTSAAKRLLAVAANSPDKAGDNLYQAKESLSAARAAYRKAEATVFFVDPESADELRAQPDPLGAGAQSGRKLLPQELGDSIEKLEKLLSRPLDASNAGSLLVEAQTAGAKIDALERGMGAMAGAWRKSETDNFRNRFFLSSPEAALARIFQGLLATTGDVLPSYLGSGKCQPEEISGRLDAVREIFLGVDDDVSSLFQLVGESSPVQSLLTRASIVRANALAGVFELSPDDESIRTQLAASLDEVTRQLVLAAETIGIQVVDLERP